MNKTVNIKVLSECCIKPIDKIIPTGKRYHYVNNGSNILGVVHLDTVQPLNKNVYVSTIKANNDKHIYNPVLDDRLGLYTLIYHLPTYHGIKLDWLFTTDEEIGNSTAMEFVADYNNVKDGAKAVYGNAPNKSWNWIVEFDRMGDDVAVYGYYGNLFNQILSKNFKKVSLGSFTDISYMEDIGLKAFNVGVGYHNPHSQTAYFSLNQYIMQIARFVSFYETNKDLKLTHTAPVYKGSNKKYSSYTEYYDDYDYGIKGTTRSYASYDYSAGFTETYECSICASDYAEPVSTLLNGESLNLCYDCLERINRAFYDV